MRCRGVSHVEFAVLDYDASIAFYDELFGWLGYTSFSSLNMEYQSVLFHDATCQPAQVHRHSAGTDRGTADASRSGGWCQSRRTVGAEQERGGCRKCLAHARSGRSIARCAVS
jgi:catechol 2,3-dioxygenase-like lactoylglutathione lyase family enzyme